MTTIALILLAAYLGLAIWMGLAADRRLARHARLPMQWWLDGRPTWYLPRRIALVAFPLVSGMGLLALVAMILMAPEGLVDTSRSLGLVLFAVSVIGIGVFALYLRLVSRWDRANP